MKKILFIALIGLITACEDKLEIVNPNQPTIEVFWKTQEDAIAGVNAVYSTLHRGAISRWMPFYYTSAPMKVRVPARDGYR